ncbi:MAG: hypothetical protein LBQ43_05040 [Holosporales bacterium]|jgi:hypothetical protein|nr:hypothetical protein [Holosporales bacterium]
MTDKDRSINVRYADIRQELKRVLYEDLCGEFSESECEPEFQCILHLLVRGAVVDELEEYLKNSWLTDGVAEHVVKDIIKKIMLRQKEIQNLAFLALDERKKCP